jgi:hypothetical protein
MVCVRATLISPSIRIQICLVYFLSAVSKKESLNILKIPKSSNFTGKLAFKFHPHSQHPKLGLFG